MTTPAGSPSARTRCAGGMQHGWSTISTRSPICTAPRSSRMRALIWWFYDDLKAYPAPNPPHGAVARTACPLPSASSVDAPASLRSIACSNGCTLTSQSC